MYVYVCLSVPHNSNHSSKTQKAVNKGRANTWIYPRVADYYMLESIAYKQPKCLICVSWNDYPSVKNE